jgi:hypothetical protein
LYDASFFIPKNLKNKAHPSVFPPAPAGETLPLFIPIAEARGFSAAFGKTLQRAQV